MAGGLGSRFWPVSTPEYPKQFVDITASGRSLIRMTVDRFKGVCPVENIWVVTSVNYREIVKKELPEIPDGNILSEPCMRNTAPCIAYVAWKIKIKDKHANIVVSAADHMVKNEAEFRRVMREGLAFTAVRDSILTVGIKPSRPETGYGYIKTDTGSFSGGIRKVEGFREKPDELTALRYFEQGSYLWNSGIFLWNVTTLEKAIRENAPEIAEIFDRIAPDLYTEREQETVNELFPSCPKISVDYAVMESAGNIWVYPADFGWSDLGTWGSLYELMDKDEKGNAVCGDSVRMVESSGCIVKVSDAKEVVVQGLEGYIVAEAGGCILICRRSDEQRIREFISK